MMALSEEQHKRIHPYKFILWIAMGSIVMMFAGFTSAYVVKRNQTNWLEFSMPPMFWYSTAVILLSSLTIYLAEKSFKARDMARYRMLVTVTSLLGVAFIIMQFLGFKYLVDNGVQITGAGSNPAGSFIGVITGVHMLHVLGGVVALLIMFAKAFNRKTKNYSSIPIEMAGIYWHFVDALWVYLFVFFLSVSG